MYLLLNMVVFYCYVSLPEGNLPRPIREKNHGGQFHANLISGPSTMQVGFCVVSLGIQTGAEYKEWFKLPTMSPQKPWKNTDVSVLATSKPGYLP